MSTYAETWAIYQANQQQAALILAGLGLAIAAGWLLLDRLPRLLAAIMFAVAGWLAGLGWLGGLATGLGLLAMRVELSAPRLLGAARWGFIVFYGSLAGLLLAVG